MCVLALLAGVAHAQAPPDRSEAERRLQVVRSELKQVATERRKLENQRGDASRKLRDADQQVGGVQRSLQQTQATLQRDGATLQQLQAERSRLTGDMQAKKAELARLLRAAQFAGSEAPLKTMLAQDRIAEAERALTYHGYLQRGQVQRIRVLSAELQRVDALEREIVERRDALDRERRKQAGQLLALQEARKQRAGLLAGIDQQYQDRAAREKALGRDAKALQDLLARLRAARRRLPATPPAPRRRPAASRQRTGKTSTKPPAAAHQPWRARRRCVSADWAGRWPAACWPRSAAACRMAAPATAC